MGSEMCIRDSFFCALPAVQAEEAASFADTLESELGRINEVLQQQTDPPHWMAIGAVTTETLVINASNGVTTSPSINRSRMADIDVRVGTNALDNTHKIRDAGWFDDDNKMAISLPLDAGHTDAIRQAIWRATDDAYRQARKRLLKVKNNLAVKVEAEDRSGDFSPRETAVYEGSRIPINVDATLWQDRLRSASTRFLSSAIIEDSNLSIQVSHSTLTIVTTE